MDKFERSVRRHHYYRLKHKRRHNSNVRSNNVHVNTPCLCSCPMCSTPRKLGEITLQEKRSIDLLIMELTWIN